MSSRPGMPGSSCQLKECHGGIQAQQFFFALHENSLTRRVRISVFIFRTHEDYSFPEWLLRFSVRPVPLAIWFTSHCACTRLFCASGVGHAYGNADRNTIPESDTEPRRNLRNKLSNQHH